MTVRRCVTTMLFLASLVPAMAAAQPHASDEAGARFRRGVELFKEADFRGALIEFRRAHELSPNFRVLYNIAQCQLELQDYAGALQSYQRYLEGGGREVSGSRRASVEATLKKLAARVATVEVKVNVPGAEIRVDDDVMGASPLDGPVLVSAGRRRFVAEKAGMPAAVKTIDVAGGDKLTVSLVVQEPPRAAAAPQPIVIAPPAKSEPEPAPPATPPPAKEGGSALWIGWVATGALAAGAVTTGVLALDAKKNLDAKLNAFPGDAAAIEDASGRVKTFSIAADVLTGAALVAGGVTLFFTFTGSSDDEKSDAKSARVGPLRDVRASVTPSRLFVEGRF